MAKTTFSALMQIPSAWLNKVFTHKHDALDQDGSCPKVDLNGEANITDAVTTKKHHPKFDNGILYLEEEA